MITEHREVEQKFDVPAGFALPDLGGLPGVASVGAPEERRLSAVYHDTADLRLARARVTLRRRTGGPDAGWHLKLPAVDGARRELQAPLGDPRTPPADLLARVVEALDGAPVAPAAGLETRRVVTLLRAGDGRVLAEVADDTVTGTDLAADAGTAPQTWREVEVELVDGDDEVLRAVAGRLLAAGAHPAAAPSKLARVLGTRLAR